MLKKKKQINFFIGTIRIYQKSSTFFKKIGVRINDSCVFYPNCTDYSIAAFEKYGFVKGTFLAIRRICRCHPWQKNHHDPI